MTRVEPGQPRATIADTPDGLQITIPALRSWPQIVFLTFWLCAWAWAERLVLGIILGTLSSTRGPDLFTLGWLGLWTLFGAQAIFTWFWSLGGREVIVLNGQSLGTKHRLWRLSLPRSKEYELSDVRDLRAVSEPYNPWWRSVSRGGSSNASGGSIAFDYGARTHRFGVGLDEAEAKQLVEQIKQRYPIAASGNGTEVPWGDPVRYNLLERAVRFLGGEDQPADRAEPRSAERSEP